MSDSEDYPPTVRIRRPAKITTDDRGRTVWAGEVEEAELELMTSGELKLALAAVDAAERESIKTLAESDKKGVVVRDRATGMYDVISESDLRTLLEAEGESSSIASRLEELAVPANDDDASDFSLVSTQALRKMLEPGGNEDDSDTSGERRGFDPYDHS